MSRILIKNPLLVATMDDRRREFHGGHILAENGIITALGPEPADLSADEVIDAVGMVVLPGLVNTHHHFYQTLTRNIPLMQNQPLFGWLTNHYQVWRELTAEAVSISTKTALLELMKSGCSTSSDHLYLFPARETGKLIDAQIAAAREIGTRFHATRGSMSLGKSQGGLPPDDTVQTEAEIQADTERLLKTYHDDGEGAMIRLALAPCSPFSVTPELMRAAAEFARANNLQIHTHLAETLDEEKFCLETYGKRPADYVDSLGWITDFAWFAHSIFLNDDEIKRLGATGAGVSHCPSSNMRLGSGIARVREMLDAGVKVSLGVDGSASNDGSNLLAEARQALLISRLREEQYWLTARDVLAIATRGGAAALGRSDIGELAVGKRADLALFSVTGLEYAGALSDPLAALVFTVRQSPVDYLLVEGVIRIRNGRSQVDERQLAQTHNRLAARMLEQAGARTGIDFRQQEGDR
ncbi:MAG: 8-oxoguanine deaminase [Candidatus Neomarinimicrobiota bacterium]